MKKELLLIISTLVLTMALGSCGTPPQRRKPLPAAPPTETESVSSTVTVTLDPCSSDQIEAEVQKVHQHHA